MTPSDFLLAYRELIKAAEDDPDNLAQRAESSPTLRRACDKVAGAYLSMFIAERYSDTQYAHNIPRAEIEAIKDYEHRWRTAVAQADPLIGPIVAGSLVAEPSDRERQRLQDAVEEGDYRATQFEQLIEWARENNNPDEDLIGFSEWTPDALRVWDDLRLRTGFHLPHVLARLEMIPFVRIPTELSKPHGSAEMISLYSRLRDAQRAFVFGAYLASAALQRAILGRELIKGIPLAGQA